MVVLAREGPLGALPAQHLVLLRAELGAPLGVGLLDHAGLLSSLMPYGPPMPADVTGAASRRGTALPVGTHLLAVPAALHRAPRSPPVGCPVDEGAEAVACAAGLERSPRARGRGTLDRRAEPAERPGDPLGLRLEPRALLTALDAEPRATR